MAIGYTDIALHTVLALALSSLLYFTGTDIVLAWAYGTFVLYLREVTQVQAKLHGNDFRKGWLLNRHHMIEWAVPGVLVGICAFLLTVIGVL